MMNRMMKALMVGSALLAVPAFADMAAPMKTSSAPHVKSQAHQHAAAMANVAKLTFTNKMVSGKKTWLPAKAQVKDGEMVELKLVNTLQDPHGFEIPGLLKPVVVPAGKTEIVKFKAAGKGDHKFDCQMHPTHVGGVLSVM